MDVPDEQHLLRIAKTIAGRYWRTGWSRITATEYDDLVQVAFIGAWRAHFRYDQAKANGSSYTSWLWHAAEGEVRHYMRDDACMIRPSRKVWERRGGDATLVPRSLDFVDEGKDGHPFDPDSEKFADPTVDPERSAVVRDLIRRLPDRLGKMVWLYYGEGWPQTEIGKMFGISQKHVSRQLRRGLTQLQALAS